jgi:hypothetical protein
MLLLPSAPILMRSVLNATQRCLRFPCLGNDTLLRWVLTLFFDLAVSAAYCGLKRTRGDVFTAPLWTQAVRGISRSSRAPIPVHARMQLNADWKSWRQAALAGRHEVLAESACQTYKQRRGKGFEP